MKKPDDNSIDFESTTIEDAAKTESPAEHAARMDELAGRFDLHQELPKPESSWQNITNIDGYLVGTTADGTKVVFASDHGDLIIRHPDGRSENRTATVEEVEKMFGITMSKMKDVNEVATQVQAQDIVKEMSRLLPENQKTCQSCGAINPSYYNYCSKCSAPFSSGSVVKEIGETEGEESEKTRKSFEEFENERYLEKSKQLEVVTSFDELYKVLRSFKHDLKGLYEDSDFYLYHRQIIEESRKSVLVRDKLPEDYGIRKKVFELCAKEEANKIAEDSNFSVPATKIESATDVFKDSFEELDSAMENTKKIEAVNSFEELFAVMDTFGEFIPRADGNKVWTVNVKNAINKYRDGSVPVDVKDILDNLGNPSDALKAVTRTFGLRKKVYELIKKEGSGVILKKDSSLKKGL